MDLSEMKTVLHSSVMVRTILTGLILLSMVTIASAKDLSRGQGKSLDEQVHGIKSEVLSIAKELDKLEERLLYPSHTQIAVFVSMRKNQTFSLDSVDIELDGKNIAYHIYTSRELNALTDGGVQNIFTGNAAIGMHEFKVTMRGKSSAGEDIRLVKSFSFEKTAEAVIAELLLSEKSITLIDR